MELIERRRTLMAAQPRLPWGYQEVEYLESTGTQYINSGIVLGGEDFKISCEFEITQLVPQEQALFSIWTPTYNYWNCFVLSRDNGIRVYTAGHHIITNVIATGNRGQVTVERIGSNWELDYENQSTQWNYAPTVENPTTLKIFTRGDTPPIANSNTHAKMYSLKVGVQKREESSFIPCYRKSDSKPGMYDLKSKTFFTNAGSREFLVAPDVHQLVDDDKTYSGLLTED